MLLDFALKDVLHRIVVKFVPAYLPGAQKSYNLRTVYEPELDIHSIASKAATYNIETSPKVVEEGMMAGMQLIYYLVADGYKIKTPVFNLKVGVPGEYDGNETCLPNGIMPKGQLTLSADLRKYLSEHVQVQFDGIEESNGLIASIYDPITDETNAVISLGRYFVITGVGLKVSSDADHANDVGVYLEKASNGQRYSLQATDIVVNEPHTIKAIPSDYLPTMEDTDYYVVVRTQAALTGGHLLKNVREMKTDFTVSLNFAWDSRSPEADHRTGQLSGQTDSQP
jgi:hypothetical protein